MIKIDGSHGEGGGQIVRTAISLSASNQKPVEIFNIRSKRSNPGLRPQHVKAIQAVSDLCRANVKGLKVGGSRLKFEPSEIHLMDMDVDIGTAGSITLFLQALLPLLSQSERKIEIRVRGGTNVKWSPPVDYFKEVFLPILNKHGFNFNLKIKRRGYYPKGGGRVILKVKPSRPKRFDVIDKGDIQKIHGISHSSLQLQDAEVAERQCKSAKQTVKKELGTAPEIKVEYVESDCPGSGIQLWAETKNSFIGGNALGEKGKPSESVGEEAAEDFLRNLKGAVDRYAADQLLPFLSMVGGKIKVSGITGHSVTNQWVIQKFLNVEFQSKGKIIKA